MHLDHELNLPDRTKSSLLEIIADGAADGVCSLVGLANDSAGSLCEVGYETIKDKVTDSPTNVFGGSDIMYRDLALGERKNLEDRYEQQSTDLTGEIAIREAYMSRFTPEELDQKQVEYTGVNQQIHEVENQLANNYYSADTIIALRARLTDLQNQASSLEGVISEAEDLERARTRLNAITNDYQYNSERLNAIGQETNPIKMGTMLRDYANSSSRSEQINNEVQAISSFQNAYFNMRIAHDGLGPVMGNLPVTEPGQNFNDEENERRYAESVGQDLDTLRENAAKGGPAGLASYKYEVYKYIRKQR